MNLLELWERKLEKSRKFVKQERITGKKAIAEKKKLEKINKPKPYKEYVQKPLTHHIAPVGARPGTKGRGDTWRYRAAINDYNKDQKTDGKEKRCIRCTRIIGLETIRLQKRRDAKYCTLCLEQLASKLGNR